MSKQNEVMRRWLCKKHNEKRQDRQAIPGKCVDIDGASWHKDGERCGHCGFGIDNFGDGRGFYNEKLIK